jgi:[glutamine synthetase] adenylyltransferase / [glutamine synthetase]-adenylyl-L-tyrosine phosphorylase
MTMYGQTMLQDLPEPLISEMEQNWQAFCDAADDSDIQFITTSDYLDAVHHVFSLSDFVTKNCVRTPQVLVELLKSGDLYRTYPPTTYRLFIETILKEAAGETAMGEALCKIRRREMIRIAWRDLLQLADLTETLSDLTAFAEACLDETLKKIYSLCCATHGTPTAKDGTIQQLVVIGMGKLGAHELNFSSDIDLVFSYPDPGETIGGRKSISNEEFFIRLSRRYIKVLSTSSVLGPLFRVDMKLRPYGENGPIVMSFDNMEDYYQTQGRDWERYAWIKARVVAGDVAAGERLLSLLRPFVYRRYIDYNMLDGIRQMKLMLEREVKRKGLKEDIKLGPGGIREIEFFGQIFQLLRGGVVPKLQERSIVKILKQLVDESYISVEITDRLIDAYTFLRKTENRLQEYADQQIHSLPSDTTNQLRLAVSMGFSDWASFYERLSAHRDFVHDQFNQILATDDSSNGASQNEQRDKIDADLDAFWMAPENTDDAVNVLERAGYDNPAEAVRLVRILQEDATTRALSLDGRKRLDLLMPTFLKQVGQSPQPLTALNQLLSLIKTIQRRTTYLSLLVENSEVMDRLIEFAIASPWLITYLTRHPVLLDEMLDPRTLFKPPNRQDLQSDMKRRFEAIDPDDLEYQMDVLRVFKQVNTLRVAAADISDAVPLMRVSDHLSNIAGEVVNKALDLAWVYLTKKHGMPVCELDGRQLEKGFTVIAYGKMGGFELGYNSDLDLVFLHAGTGKQTVGGNQPIDTTQFFARLAQRALHILTAHTPAGTLYETDTRLRPSGAGGLLVSHINAFESYQLSDAWTWEHQAIVRARAIWGEQALQDRFETIRRKIISQPRAKKQLLAEVLDMRLRLRHEHGSKDPNQFHLKQDGGGMVDIEFIVQYIVLLMSHQYADLMKWTDNVRLIQSLAKTNLIDDQIAHLLRTAYLTYRSMAHRLSLQEKVAVVPTEMFQNLQKSIRALWAQIFV